MLIDSLMIVFYITVLATVLLIIVLSSAFSIYERLLNLFYFFSIDFFLNYD